MLRRTRGAKLGLRRCSNLPGLALFKHRSRLIIRDGDWRLEVGTETNPWTVDPTTRGGSGQRASGSHGGSRPQLARIFQRHQRAPDISGAGSPARPPGPTPSRRGPPRAAACATAGIFRAAWHSHSWTRRTRHEQVLPTPFRWVPTQRFEADVISLHFFLLADSPWLDPLERI